MTERHTQGANILVKALAGSCLLVALSASAQATTFYVRASGSDQNDGRTPGTAFASIELAARSLVNAGDRVVVGPGAYSAANITPIRNGTTLRPIVFRADTDGTESGDPAGAVVIHVRASPGELNSGFILYGRKYIVIDGFTIQGATDPGIQVRPEPVSRAPSQSIELRNNHVIGGAKSGIEVQAVGEINIHDNEVRDNRETGIAVTGSQDDLLDLKGNLVVGNLGTGILVEDVSGVRLSGNHLESNRGIGILVRRSDSIVVSDNAVQGNVTDAICAGCGLDATSIVRDVEIDGNMIEAGGHTGVHAIGTGMIRIGHNVVNTPAVGILATVDDATDLGLSVNTVSSAQEDGLVVRRVASTAPPAPTPAVLSVSSNTVTSSRGYGISLGLAEAPLVQPIEMAHNAVDRNGAGGIRVFTSGYFNATDNTATNNMGSGISAELSGAPTAAITSSTVSGNNAHGIFLTGASAGSITLNTIQGNRLNGILVHASDGLSVTRNTVRNNDGGIATGIEPGLLGDCNRDGTTAMNDLVVGVGVALGQLSVSDCSALSRSAEPTADIADLVMAVSVAASGVMTHGLGQDADISDNTIENHGKFGILTFARGLLTVEANKVKQSATVGISATSDEHGEIVLSDNMISTSGSDGALVAKGGQLTVDSNRIDTSGDNGIRVIEGGSLKLTDNQVSGSSKSGILGEALGNVIVSNNRVVASGAVGLSLAAQAGGVILPVVTGNQVSNSLRGGMVVERAKGGSLASNVLTATTGDGITILASAALSVSANNLFNTQGHGIVVGSEIDPGANFVLSGNRIGHSEESGINLWGSQDSRLLENEILDSGTAGISVRMLGPRATSTVTGNTVGRNAADGVTVSGTVRATIQNNVLFSNGEAGVVLHGARNSSVINNLVYANARFGIAIGTGSGQTIGSADAVIASNTIYRNGQFGIVIGTSTLDQHDQPLPQSPGALIVNNAFKDNGFAITGVEDGGGIGIASGSLHGVVTGFNVNPDGYGDGIRVSPYDHAVDPAFMDPDGGDNILGGLGYADDDFRLRRTPVDQRSPAIDAGSGLAADVGITGSCLQGTGSDSGVLDVCYHYGATVDQVVHVSLPDLPMRTFVRKTGDAVNDGLSPQRAFASILSAAEKAAPGTTVVVGPGRYNEGDLHVRNNVSGVTFLADSDGALTGDSPGPVIIDPTGCERCTDTQSGPQCRPCSDTGFVLVDTPDVTIDGFYITGAGQAAIQVRAGSGGAVIRNNVVFSNLRRGIEAFIGGVATVPPADPIDGIEIDNNLIYANGSGGIRVQDAVNGVLSNNTVYGNGISTDMSDAILIGSIADEIPTRGMVLVRNVVQANRDVGIRVETPAQQGYVTGSNVALGLTNPLLAYAGNTPRDDSDFLGDALLVNPAGIDGILGGAGFADDDFHLQQGGTIVSPAVDIDGSVENELKGGSTAVTGRPDTGPGDAGYHYRVPFPWPMLP